LDANSQNAIDLAELEIIKMKDDAIIKAHEAYKVLKETDEWKSLFDTFMFEKEPVRLVLLLGDPNSADIQDGIKNRMTMVSELSQFFRALPAAYNQKAGQIKQHEDYILALRKG